MKITKSKIRNAFGDVCRIHPLPLAPSHSIWGQKSFCSVDFTIIIFHTSRKMETLAKTNKTNECEKKTGKKAKTNSKFLLILSQSIRSIAICKHMHTHKL